MKMSDVKVGMRLVSSLPGAHSPITVTKLTVRGFKYDLDEAKCIHPRLGMTVAKTGHEHFGVNGDALYEPEKSADEQKEHRGFFILSPVVLADRLPLPAGTKITGARWDEMTRRIVVFVEHPDLVESYEGLPVMESHVIVTDHTRAAEPGDLITTSSAKWNQ